GGALRTAMFVVGVAIWIGWTTRYAAINRHVGQVGEVEQVASRDLRRHLLILVLVLAPMAAYIYGALRLDWGFNELSAGFLAGGVVAGIVGGLGLGGTVAVYLEGMQSMLPPAIMVGVARSISLVLTDGRVVDTILHGLVTALGHVP